MSINLRIKDVRKSRSQTEFGRIIGATRNQIAFAEGDGHKVSDLLIKNICLSFNVNETWLRTGEGEMFLVSSSDSVPTEREIAVDYIVRTFSKISDANCQKFVLEVCRRLLQEDQQEEEEPTFPAK